MRPFAFFVLLFLIALPYWSVLKVGFLQDDYDAANLFGPDPQFDGRTLLRLFHPPESSYNPWLQPLATTPPLPDSPPVPRTFPILGTGRA